MDTILSEGFLKPLPLRPWLARLGRAGFLFFLVKGLAWLVLPGLVWVFG